MESDVYSKFALNGYSSIIQGNRCCTKGGLTIYTYDKHKIEVIRNLNDHWESVIIKENCGN